MIRSLSPALWVCLAFLLVSSSRILLLGGAVSVDKVLSGGFPFLELIGVLIAGVLIRATRGRPWIQAASLLMLVPGYAGWSASAGESLVPFQDWLPRTWLDGLVQLRSALTVLSLAPLILLGQFRKTGGLLLELLPCFLMVLAYPFVPLMIRASGGPDLDATLLRADEWLFGWVFGGVNPHFWISARLQPGLTEWFAFCYSLYGALILAVFGVLILADRREDLRCFVLRFTWVLAIGYTFYTLVPVQGPVFKLDYPEPMDLRYLQGVKEALMDRTRIEWDCFPSLHTALTLLVWGTLLQQSRKLAWIVFPIALTVPVACVALRYHYVVDVWAGAVLAVGVMVKIKKAPGEKLS